MKSNIRRIFRDLALALSFYSVTTAFSQNLAGGEVHGNFGMDMQYYNADSAIGAPAVPEKMLENSFANINYTNSNFTAGVRFESYLNTLQGFDPRYNNSGVPFKFIRYNIDGLEVTAGNYYEQFGSGLVFRSYEERGLGLDNAMNGVKLKYNPFHGITIKGIWGKQRSYWADGPGIVRGADAEFSLNEIFTKYSESRTRVLFGASAVSKYQKDESPVYIMPQNVAAFAGRLNLSRGKVNFYGEYCYKINDPSLVNGFIYKPGQALLLNASYSQKGLGFSIGAKRIDNMNFRSDANAVKTDLNINYLPALTKQHSYLLAAIYPYATQPNGELGLQMEMIYTFKKGSPLGGTYGTTVAMNYSRANALNRTAPSDTSVLDVSGTLGYSSKFLDIGKTCYFEDANIEVSKKISSKFKMAISYLFITYNKDVIQGSPGYGTIYSHIHIAELTYKFNDSHTLRTEFQHLYTKKDQKNWAMALAELSFAPHWFIAALDMYNYGNSVSAQQIHYFNFSTGYTHNANRIAIGYGKQRAGLFCVGGVCRTVPASNGITLSITSSF